MKDQEKEVVDTYWEHEIHFEYDPHCSECYKKYKKENHEPKS